MQFKAFEPDIEVNGQAVYSIVEGFGHFKSIASKLMLDARIGTKNQATGLVQIEPDHWYSQEAWLKVFERIAGEMGGAMLHSIGMAIPKSAIFPPWVKDVHSAVQSIDVAYHLNHRKNGEVMFDRSTGKMREGIGHYGYKPMEGQKKIISVCENPYPCDFDRGIITAMVRRFEPFAFVMHDDHQPCRKKGDNSCTYVITW